jgi:serine/threonine protein kinase
MAPLIEAPNTPLAPIIIHSSLIEKADGIVGTELSDSLRLIATRPGFALDMGRNLVAIAEQLQVVTDHPNLIRFVGIRGYENYEALPPEIKLLRTAHIETITERLDTYEETQIQLEALAKLPDFVISHEYFAGNPLDSYKSREKLACASTGKIFDVFTQIAQGLMHLHSNGIIHRDIKPSNIFLSHIKNNYTPKIGDYELALPIEHDINTRLDLVGDARYSAPELFDSRTEIDITADIFSLALTFGDTMLQCFYPNRAFIYQYYGRNAASEADIEKFLGWIREYWPTVGTVFTQALQKDKSLRYQSVQEFMIEFAKAYTKDTLSVLHYSPMGTDSNSPRPNIVESKITALTEKKRLHPDDAFLLAQHLHEIAPILVTATHQSPSLVRFVASVSVPHKQIDNATTINLNSDPFYSFAAKPPLIFTSDDYKFTYHGVFHTDYLHVHERASGIPLASENLELPAANTLACARLVFQLCDAVDSLHNAYYFGPMGNILRAAIIHRDIRPDNILYTVTNNEPQVMLMDYDIAKLESCDTKIRIGNGSYSPPEQYYGEAYRQSDIFSLALTIFDILIGNIGERSQEKGGIYNRNSAYPKNSDEYDPFIEKYPLLGEVFSKAFESFYYNRQQSVKEFWFDFSIAWQKEFNQELPQMEFSSNKALKRLTEVKQIMDEKDSDSKRARLKKVLAQ